MFPEGDTPCDSCEFSPVELLPSNNRVVTAFNNAVMTGSISKGTIFSFLANYQQLFPEWTKLDTHKFVQILIPVYFETKKEQRHVQQLRMQAEKRGQHG
jgi:hypothetical protein